MFTGSAEECIIDERVIIHVSGRMDRGQGPVSGSTAEVLHMWWWGGCLGLGLGAGGAPSWQGEGGARVMMLQPGS